MLHSDQCKTQKQKGLSALPPLPPHYKPHNNNKQKPHTIILVKIIMSVIALVIDRSIHLVKITTVTVLAIDSIIQRCLAIILVRMCVAVY